MADSASQLPAFDRVARLYRWAEYLIFGPLLQRTRTALLSGLPPPRQDLLFGDGDARFLEQLMRRQPQLKAVAVDASATMLHLLRTRCAAIPPIATSRLQILQASALDASIPPGTDLVVTHFFLDCLSQADVNSLAYRIASQVQPGCLWLVSDFAVPAPGAAPAATRALARLLVAILYKAFRLLTRLHIQQLPDPQAALTAAGFQRIASRQLLAGLLYSELWRWPSDNPTVRAAIHLGMGGPSNEDAQFAAEVHDALPGADPNAPSLPEPDTVSTCNRASSPATQP